MFYSDDEIEETLRHQNKDTFTDIQKLRQRLKDDIKQFATKFCIQDFAPQREKALERKDKKRRVRREDTDTFGLEGFEEQESSLMARAETPQEMSATARERFLEQQMIAHELDCLKKEINGLIDEQIRTSPKHSVKHASEASKRSLKAPASAKKKGPKQPVSENL